MKVGVRSEGSEPTASLRSLVGEKIEGWNSAISAGVCGAVFIGSCIYFDHRRRSDPNFKNRLRERRKKQKLAKERAGLSKLPNLKDAEAVQKFFLEEIQLGEELLAQGEYEKGVDHLTNAIAVCGQPQQLLQVLQQTVPPPVFQRLLTKLPTTSQRILSAQSLAEDDVE
ncbi:mitochondrial import receptor subunit TOM20 homolog [Balaenoptera ricei]|uniref:mitochondrial import receptor subunit TOM20 homolog n=1 Tax=Balaenoptera ricei TaxID=2746895 RepID=UPI0028BE78E0|nr:mitochondrial import receptor subunit TOM20 homolog [Balaenoptera ricei]